VSGDRTGFLYMLKKSIA